jgi:hypothetical protein
MGRLPALFAAFALIAGAPGVALAGSNNLLYLSQQTDPSALDPNLFDSDQTAATATMIGTLNNPAQQSGHGNSAAITLKSHCPYLTESCGTAQLVQDNSVTGVAGGLIATAGTLAPNVANITISGLGNASVVQAGGDNRTTLTVDSGLGVVSQSGIGNQATVDLSGATNGNVAQVGNNNTANFSVTTLGNANVSVQQIGNNRSYNATIMTTGPLSIVQVGM